MSLGRRRIAPSYVMREPDGFEGISDRRGLYDALTGLSDEEILTRCRSYGVEHVLTKVFGVCSDVYDAPSGPSKRSVVRWDVAADGTTHRWWMIADRDRLVCTQVDPGSSDLTASTDLAVFLRVMSRVTHGAVEVAKGGIRFKGKLLLAMAIDGWFPER